METAGMHKGWMLIRWQGVPQTRASGDGLIRDFRVLKVDGLSSVLPPEAMGVTHEQRARDRERRQAEWRIRIAEGNEADPPPDRE